MKKIPGLFLLLLVLACASEKFDKPRKKPKWVKMETPPGTVWLRDSLFIDRCEISNYDYRQFLNWMQGHEPERYLALVPDTNVWSDNNSSNTPYINFYLRHQAFADYPVVGVSLGQATAYCDWRAERINEMMYIRDNKIKWNPDGSYPYPKKVRCRLPSHREWAYAAQAGLNYLQYPLGFERVYKKDSAMVDNLRENDKLNYLLPLPVKSYWVNRYNIYHMLGNVSELTSDSLIMGLNFLNDIDGNFPDGYNPYSKTDDTLSLHYTIKSYMKYERPAACLGFRCVCEVLP